MTLSPLKICLTLTVLVFSLSFYGQRDSLSYLALGDSYTIGTSELPKNSWPVQLAERFSEKGTPIKKPLIIAGAGWTTERLLKEIGDSDLKSPYDLVSLLIGVNNQYRGQDISIFTKDLRKLLDLSISLAGNNKENVFVVSIPDWSVTPFARLKDGKKIVREISQYNAIIKQETDDRGILLINVTDISRNAAVNQSLIASDSLHPSKKMYRAWVKKIQKKLQKKLD